MKTKLCPICKKHRIEDYESECHSCWYKRTMRHMNSLTPEDRDWVFTVCEECGSSLDSDGVCRNTNCGASPDCGKDWI